MVSVNDVKGTAGVLHEMAFDVVIRGGRVLDGTGSPWRIADIGIRRGKIVRVGPLGRAKCDRTIDTSGTYVAPGFIDIHTHSDIGILVEPTAECAVRQGVTTQVIGNCGDSPAPISERYRELAVRRFEYYAQAKDWNWAPFGNASRSASRPAVRSKLVTTIRSTVASGRRRKSKRSGRPPGREAWRSSRTTTCTRTSGLP